MSKNKHKHQQGFAITALVAIVSLVSLVISGTKVATHVYEKSETQDIANQFREQANHLANRAKDMGKGGDEAVRESLRLNKAAKDIEKHGTVVYQQKMITEAANLTKSLVISQGVGAATEGVAQGLGATAETAKQLSQASGILLDAEGIEVDLEQAEKTAGEPVTETKEGRKLYELIQGSKSNVDDFNRARVKAMTDELINMREDLKEMGDEISGWIAIREQALKDLEQAAYLRRLKQRERSRLTVLENDDLGGMVKKEFAGKSGPIDVVKGMSGRSESEWAQISKDAEEKARLKSADDQKPEGKLTKKDLNSTNVPQALKATQKDFSWTYYDDEADSSWNIWNINKNPPAGEMWSNFILVYQFHNRAKFLDWTSDAGKAKDYGNGNSSTIYDVGFKAPATCSSGGELRFVPQDMWYIISYATTYKDCNRALEYLLVFWSHLK